MRIVDVRERSIPISRYADPDLPSGGLTTSLVAVRTDVLREGRPVVGYGFSSIGRFAQSGLIHERFAPRLLAAPDAAQLDPFRAWEAMLHGEKPGGHGERCVAVGTLDMAIWDAAAKIAGLPLHRFLAVRLGRDTTSNPVPVYAGGGYPYPTDDVRRLTSEVRELLALGFERVKIKVGAAPLAEDRRRIEAVLALLPAAGRLAVDAMNAYGPVEALGAAAELDPYDLWWFEDVCDPLDFETLAAVAEAYRGPIAAGEALFSDAEAKLLDAYGGLHRDRDVLLFDPVHCYGLPGFLRIVDALEGGGWPRSSFWPHGGHLWCLHVVAALGLGGAEVNPLSFWPVGGLSDGQAVRDGCAELPEAPGVGFETKADLYALFRELGEE
ncbi:MAG TPA: enolase C-terminal domain-like protein [Candidatus Binatia bacterium]|nr:enolase C-terminal domain-like protein [Candidatus Binatia bacterium]